MATEQNIRLFRGGSYQLLVELLNDDGSVLNPSAVTLHYRIAHSVDHVALLEVDEPVLTKAEVTGSWYATIPLETADTVGLPVARLFHELYLDDNGELSPLMQGLVQVYASQAAMQAGS